MKAFIPAYNLVAPKSLEEALLLIYKNDHTIIAGGTDLMVQLESGRLATDKIYVSLHQIKTLKGIQINKEETRIGALTTFGEIRNHKTLKNEFPLLIEAAQSLGSLAIQNRATLGGNIANASPAADSAPPLLLYDAKLELISLDGQRTIFLRDLYLDYKKLSLKNGELIKTIILPSQEKGLKCCYQKVGTRGAQSISKISFCSSVKMKTEIIQDIRLAWGAIAPIPMRTLLLENYLRGKVIDEDVITEAIKYLSFEISPIDDIRSQKVYRERVAQNILRNFLENL